MSKKRVSKKKITVAEPIVQEVQDNTFRIVRQNGAPLKFMGKIIAETLEIVTDDDNEVAGSIQLRIYKSDSSVYVGEIKIQCDNDTHVKAHYEYSLRELSNFFMDEESDSLITGAIDLFEQTKLDWDEWI